jgi:hydrogenase expression/formation protein HypC
MCLGVPGRVIEVDDFVAVVDFWGVKRRVRLDIVDEPVAPGDYVLNHVGFAIRRIPPEDVELTLRLYEELLESNGTDLMTADVRSEMDATASASQSHSFDEDADRARERCAEPDVAPIELNRGRA